MRVTASDRPGADAPIGWLAAGGVVALGLLLIAGDGPLRPALATFGLGILLAVGLTWGYGAAQRRLARRRAAAGDAVVVREAIARLRRGLEAGDGAELHELAASLDAIAGTADPGPPQSLAALARAAAAAVRRGADARDVRVVVAVADDTSVRGPGLELALAALLRRAIASAPAGSTVTRRDPARPRGDPPRRRPPAGRRLPVRARPRRRASRGRRRPHARRRRGDAHRARAARRAVSAAGYSGTPLPRKLGIKPGHRVALLGAPGRLRHARRAARRRAGAAPRRRHGRRDRALPHLAAPTSSGGCRRCGR